MRQAFGHHAVNVGGVHFDSWGRGPLLLRYGGREWWFEFSDMFGPTLLRKTDLEPAQGQPEHDYHPFWPAFDAWTRAGRRHRPIWSKRRRISGQPRRVKFYLCYADRGEVLV